MYLSCVEHFFDYALLARVLSSLSISLSDLNTITIFLVQTTERRLSELAENALKPALL